MYADNKHKETYLPKKLSVMVIMALSFLTLAQVKQHFSQDESIRVEKLNTLFVNLYDFTDSTLYYRRLDSFQMINNQVLNDSIHYFYDVLYNYCKAQLEIEKRHYIKAEPLLEHSISAIRTTYKINELNIFYKLSYQWLGEIKKSQGKYQEAIEAFQNSIYYEDQVAYSIASTEKLIGETYALQDDWRNAFIYYQKSLHRLLTYHPNPKAPQDKIEKQKSLLRVYEAIAVYYREKSQLDSAQVYLEKRRPLLNINTESNMIDSYLLDALLYAEIGKYNEATNFYDKALQLAKAQRDIAKIGEIYQNRAKVYYNKGNYRIAVIDADSAMMALSVHQNIIYKKDYLQALNIKTNGLIKTYQQNHSKNLDQLNIIFSLTQKSIELIDSISNTYQNIRDKQMLLGLQRNIFTNGIWTSEQLYDYTSEPKHIEQAFQWSEQSRSIILRSITQLDQIQHFTGVPDSIIEKDEAFRKTNAALDHTLRLGGIMGESPQFRTEALKQKTLQHQFLAQLQVQYPEYYQFKYQPKIKNSSLIKNAVKPSQSILEFFIYKDEVYAFLLNSERLKFQKLDITEEVINSQVAEIMHFTKGEQANKAAFQQTAFFLYQKLILPFEAELSEEVIVIPDGKLSLLPFETLLYEATAPQQSLTTLPYWIKKHSISYHYAATLLTETNNSWSKATEWAVFAPNFSDEPSFQDDIAIDFFEKNIGKANVFKESQATKATFKSKMKSCQILHINTHGIANDSVGDLSYLRLSDANFYSGELYETAVKADLVTLSACQTANGELRYGEGTIGLTFGFLYAGAKAVMSSLWNVNQQSTSTFMQQFYRRLLEEELPNNQALRAAKLAIIEENPNLAHPKFWAPFVLIGKPDTIIVKHNYWIWMGAFCLMLFCSTMMYYYFKKKKL